MYLLQKLPIIIWLGTWMKKTMKEKREGWKVSEWKDISGFRDEKKTLIKIAINSIVMSTKD